ncbi:hypothetical protein ICN30_04520 [Polynucleobacter sp. 31A-FELB]|uniref:O-antigen ligase family protein n=1 Tax=Polynucleobacter sp. 31A-FELB TaxID=2689096 RepID=UPI001C0C664B|nr:O-antigen ligase family protein [Polynucleobacter sp. 31A-FELB]MBU3587089.1 hypothetical protein [Polynucleobacter sp. 31A-FELB]
MNVSPYKNTQYFSVICLISVIGLLGIWVLPNTIALRHVFLGIGFISSLAVIYKSNFFARRNFGDILPLFLLSLVFIWALVHYLFFSLNPNLELQELKSIWARSLAGAVIAIGLSIALRIQKDLRPWFFISLFLVSWINLAAYFYLSYEEGRFILPSEFVWKFVFKKIEAAFFGVIAISIACANLVNIMSQKLDKKSIIYMALWFLAITTAIISSLVANTKNGVAVALGLCVLLGLTLIYMACFKAAASRMRIFIPVAIVCLMLLASWKVHVQFATQGWGTLIEDIQISSQLDQHNFWRFNSPNWNKVHGESFPTNSRGLPVAGNTYERVAWATQGMILIRQYPMGYGSINRSFAGMLNHAGIRQELENQTHSGWIDFGLAFGIPGICIFLILFSCIVYLGLRNNDQFGLMGTWLIIGFIPFGIIAEINYKHNFEILLFFIAFAAASSIRFKDPQKQFS